MSQKTINRIKSFSKGLTETILITYVSASMFIYGALKYLQFGVEPYSKKVVSELTNMQLMWAFYGRTLEFPLIIGFFEILGAGLLFFRKTRIIGCFLLTSILVNIIIQDIIYDVLAGAIVSASIYQIIIIYILWKYRLELINAIKIIGNISSKKSLLKSIIHVVIGLIISIIIKMSIGL